MVVAIVPPPPVVVPKRQRMSFSAESMFTFDRSEVRPEGKTALIACLQPDRRVDIQVVGSC